MKNYIFIKKILTSACVIYTFLITAVFLLGVFVNSAWVPTLNMVLALLVFSLVLSAANQFLFSEKLVFSLRLLIHFIVTTLCFYIVFVLWGGYKNNGGNVLMVLLIYTFAYVIFTAIVGCYRYLTADLRAAEKKYETQFQKKDDYNSQFGA
ncbi:MAG: DUF3021 domain-containing protein [Ruminococcaceae bacterium]|nr:DUF3021 domain-containing protein [Oscillospiraceae bacterium]